MTDNYTDESPYKCFAVEVRSVVTVYVYALNAEDVANKWRECMEDNPGYIEDLYNNAEVYNITQED